MKNYGIFIRLTAEDRETLNILRKKYSINVSQLFRNVLEEKRKELNENKKN